MNRETTACLRTPIPDDYKRLERACEENNAEFVKVLCKKAAIDPNNDYGGGVSEERLRPFPSDWMNRSIWGGRENGLHFDPGPFPP